MTAAPEKRFTIFGAVGLAGLAMARRPAALLLVVLLNAATTASLAGAKRAWLQGPDALPFSLATQLLFALNDATLATLALVIAVEGLRGDRFSWRDRWRTTLSLFAPAALLAVVDTLPHVVHEVTAILWARGVISNLFGWLVLADVMLAVTVACTVGLAAFAGLEGISGLGAMLRRSLQLTGRARWRLGWLALMAWILTGIVSLSNDFIARAMVGSEQPVLQSALEQAIYTCWFMLLVILTAGIGMALARPEQEREGVAGQFE